MSVRTVWITFGVITLFLVTGSITRGKFDEVTIVVLTVLGVALLLYILRKKDARQLAGEPIEPIDSLQELERMLAGDRSIVFKHSTACGVSAWALKEVLEFKKKVSQVSVFVIKVIEQREVSNTLSERLGVTHQSPQIIYVRDGSPVWSTSHGNITSSELIEHLPLLNIDVRREIA